MPPLRKSRPQAKLRSDEFPPGAPHWPVGMDRRQFLQVSASLLAMLGASCRPPRDEILPYVKQPEDQVAGLSSYYATTYHFQGFARGLLAESHQGRPTKLEGNPQHPDSLGATDASTQASVLGLYDPARPQAPEKHGQVNSWDAWKAEMWAAIGRCPNGKGLAIAMPPTSSPTVQRQLKHLRETFPQAAIAVDEPRWGPPPEPWDYDLESADVILGVEPDFLTNHPSSIRYARNFAKRRRGWETELQLNRFYALHSAPSVTVSMADEAHAATPDKRLELLKAIANQLNGGAKSKETFAQHAAEDLRKAGSRALVIPGTFASDSEKELCAQLNDSLGNEGTTRHSVKPVRIDCDNENLMSMDALGEQMDQRNIRVLLLLNVDPLTHGQDIWRQRLKQVSLSCYFSTMHSEAAQEVDWMLPRHHYLEEWMDLRAFSGEISIQQPLISPLYNTVGQPALLNFLLTGVMRPSYEVVRQTWLDIFGQSRESIWRETLRQGVGPKHFPQRTSGSINKTPPKPKTKEQASKYTLLMRPDPFIDEANANNPWLLELPDPITKQTWGNALWMNPEEARALNLKAGSVVRLNYGNHQVDIPVRPVLGLPANTLLAYAGYGRKNAGPHASSGVAIFPGESWTASASIQPIGKQVEMAETQHHFKMDGHDFVQLRKPGQEPKYKPQAETDSLYGKAPDKLANGDHAWAMSIDLSSCIGCQACVVACQAENNIPSVGEEQVRHGRIMHWIRVDSYQDTNGNDSTRLHQPVACMHCEKAPCEPVCPVEATVHTASGLNAMVYNRCVGTRYCSNNCPYKVRRFNFLDYQESQDSPSALQKNPNVTVRERGVMEKCTYCVQRINRARNEARREQQALKTDAVQTACQQVCPTNAIVFGDFKDPASAVRRRHHLESSYSLLKELDVRPRTQYLPRWLNPYKEESHG